MTRRIWVMAVIALAVLIALVVLRSEQKDGPRAYAERMAIASGRISGVDVVGVQEPSGCDGCAAVVGSYSFGASTRPFVILVGRQDLPVDRNPMDFDVGKRVASRLLSKPSDRIYIYNKGVGVGLATVAVRGAFSDQELRIRGKLLDTMEAELDEDRRSAFQRPG